MISTMSRSRISTYTLYKRKIRFLGNNDDIGNVNNIIINDNNIDGNDDTGNQNDEDDAPDI